MFQCDSLDRLQRIVKKMRIDLAAQVFQLCLLAAQLHFVQIDGGLLQFTGQAGLLAKHRVKGAAEAGDLFTPLQLQRLRISPRGCEPDAVDIC